MAPPQKRQKTRTSLQKYSTAPLNKNKERDEAKHRGELANLIITDDQERSLVQELHEYQLESRSFHHYYDHIYPRKALSGELLNRYNDSSLDVQRFWRAQERRELTHMILPGEVTASPIQKEAIKVYRASDAQKLNDFRTRLHRELTSTIHSVLAFDLEKEKGTNIVVLALFGVPDGRVHIVDLRTNAPGQPLEAAPLREVLGEELALLIERKPIVISQGVEEDCNDGDIYPQRVIELGELSALLDRSLLPRGDVTPLIPKSGLGCFSVLILGYHLKKVVWTSKHETIDDAAVSSGLWSWPYKGNTRRSPGVLYRWPRDMSNVNSLRHRLYCYMDIVVSIDVVYRFILQRLTTPGSEIEDSTVSGWTERLLKPFIISVVRTEDSPTHPAPREEVLSAPEESGEISLAPEEFVALPPELEYRPEQPSSSQKRDSKGKRSLSSSGREQLTKQERKKQLDEFHARINRPAPLHVVRTKDRIVTVTDIRCVKMPGGAVYRSGLWQGYSGEPHDGQHPGVSRHILQCELLYTILPPLFHVLRKVLETVTGIKLPEVDPHHDFSKMSDEGIYQAYGPRRIFEVSMPSGYDEDWKKKTVKERINDEMTQLQTLRNMRFPDDHKNMAKVDPAYGISRENKVGSYRDPRQCFHCGSPRHGRPGESCSLLRKQEYYTYRESRDNQLCSYPLCRFRQEHLTNACPTLSQRCSNCFMRGHDAPICPGKLIEQVPTMEALRTVFEAYADLNIGTERRTITERSEPKFYKMAVEGSRLQISAGMGFHPVPYDMPRGELEYDELLRRPVLLAQRLINNTVTSIGITGIWDHKEFQQKFGCIHRTDVRFYSTLGCPRELAIFHRTEAELRKRAMVDYEERKKFKAETNRAHDKAVDAERKRKLQASRDEEPPVKRRRDTSRKSSRVTDEKKRPAGRSPTPASPEPTNPDQTTRRERPGSAHKKK